MIPLRECAAIAGLDSEELVVGARPRPRHWRILSGYLANLDKGPAVVCGLIIADLRAYLDLGAKERAASVLVVLRLLLTQFPHLAKDPIPQLRWSHAPASRSHFGAEMVPPDPCHGENENSPSSRGVTVRPFRKTGPSVPESDLSRSS